MTPWAIDPRYAELVAELLNGPSAIGLADFVRQRDEMCITGGLAHIHVFGPLVDNQPAIYEMVGCTDYRTLRAEIAAAADSDARGIMLHIDSPGGMVAGIEEVTRDLKATGLPVIASCDGMACSGAYWLACCADEIVAEPSAELGSVGVVMVWNDYTEAAKREGIAVNVMTNEGADLKGMFHGVGLTDVQIDHLQSELNAIGERFKEHVSAARPDIDAEVWRAGHYSGQKAIDLGLADGVAFDNNSIAMGIQLFTTKQELQERIETISGELEEATALAAEKAEECVALSQESAAKDETIAGLNARLAEQEAAIAKHAEEIEAAQKLLSDAEAKINAFEQRVNDRAAEVVASAGHETVTIQSDDKPDVVAVFNSLSGAEKTRFYREHKAAIRAASGN